jgi:DNA-binding transcriptional MerR regulator
LGADAEPEVKALEIIKPDLNTKSKPLPPAKKKQQRSDDYMRAKALKILELRVQGHSFDEIAELLDYKSGKHVQAAYTRLMDKHESESVQQLRQLQNERLEMAWQGLVPKIEQGRERAVEVGMKVLERQARLHGIDVADQITEKSTGQPIQINIMAHPGDPRAQAMIIDQEQPKQLEERKDG